MSRAKVYRNIDRKQQWLGLEPVDALGLALVLWVLLTFHRGALAANAVILGGCYVGLRVAKRGKPAGHTTALLRYVVMPRGFLSAGAPDLVGRRHRFVATTHGSRAASDPNHRRR
jgi:hypothetical protein